MIITGIIAMSYLFVIKQMVLISVTLIFSYLLLNSYEFDLVKIFKDYIFFITLAAGIVVLQYIGRITNLSFLIDYSYLGIDNGKILLNTIQGRYHSWFYEPSFMAYAFMPVIFIAVARLFGIGDLLSVRKSIFLIIILFMAKSSLGLFGLLLSFLILIFSKYPLYKKPVILFFLIVGFVIGFFGIYQIPAVKFRVDETYAIYAAKNVTSIEVGKTNISTYALYSNFKITEASVKESPLFGSGIGTYELNYDKHLFDVIPSCNWRNLYKINRQDANSLFFRILVETGLIGAILFIYFVLKNRIYLYKTSNIITQNLWAINNGIFVLLVLRLLRQGHYTMLGFILMILIYNLSKKQAVYKA